MATVAFQTTYSVRADSSKAAQDGASSRLLNTCHAYASNRSVVKRRWPGLYDGPADAPAGDEQPVGQSQHA